MADKELQEALSEVEMNNLYELSLSNTLTTLVIIALLMFALFPLVEWLFPILYEPYYYLDARNTGMWKHFTWFIDVFLQPLSVFAQRGNLCLMYVVFQGKMASLFTSVALIAFVFLIPIYVLGTDESFNLRYQTVWSEMSIEHIEEGSKEMLFPLICLVIIPLCVVAFYEDFVDIYAEYRQKCLKRIIPENFVVMISNLPSNVDTHDKLFEATKHVLKGVKQVVPIPPNSFVLTYLEKQLRNVIEDLKTARLNEEAAYAKFQKYEARTDSKNAGRMYWYLQDLRKTVKSLNLRKFKIQTRIMRWLYKSKLIKNIAAGVDVSLPHIMEPYYLTNTEHHEDTVNGLNYNELYNIPPYLKKDLDLSRYISEFVNTPSCERIGRSAFFVCESQQQASQKSNLLLSKDSESAKVSIAPTPTDIIWHNLGFPNWVSILRLIVFCLLILGLFIVYTVFEAFIMGQLNDNAPEWNEGLNRIFCGKSCANELAAACSRCQKTNESLVTFVPAVVNAVMMNLLPEILEICLWVLGLNSEEEADQLEYKITFFFEVTIEGILQVALPTVVSPENGTLELSLLLDMTVADFLLSLGRNLPNQVFVFINYILGNYFIIPIIRLVNFPGMIAMLWYKITTKNKTDFILKYEKALEFKYSEGLAETAHMFVIGLMFGIVSPFTLLITLLTFAMIMVVDRYYLLYLIPVTADNELKPQATLLKSVASCIYIGLYFLLFGVFAFLRLFEGEYYEMGKQICVAMFIIVIACKYMIDRKYNRSSTELAAGDFRNSATMVKGSSWILRIISVFAKSNMPVSFQNELGRSIVISDDIIKHYELLDDEASRVANEYLHPVLRRSPFE